MTTSSTKTPYLAALDPERMARVRKLLQSRKLGAVQTLDGDTVRGESPADMRLGGIDAPEKDQVGGPESREGLRSKVADSGVTVRKMGRDGHGREVSSLYLGDDSINVKAVRDGHAVVYRDFLRNVSPKMQQELLAAEDEAKNAKRGVWSNPDFELPQDFRVRKNIQKYDAGGGGKDPLAPQGSSVGEAALGALGRLGNALDAFGNPVKSGIKGALDAPEGYRIRAGLQATKEAITGDRRTSATELRDALNRRMGHGKVRFGKDNDGETTAGDWLDFASDVAVDAVTDPLTYLTGGLSALGKAGSAAAKLAPRAHQAAVGAKLAKAAKIVPTGDAATYAKAMAATKAGLGGAMGFSATNPDDPWQARLAAAGAGALAPKAVGTLAPKVGKALQGAGDEVYDAYARATGKVSAAPDGYKDLWAQKNSGELARRAKAQADTEIAPVKSVDELAERNQAVAKRAAEIEETQLKPVKEFIETEAERIVSKQKFPDAASRQEALQLTAKRLSVSALTDLSPSATSRLARAAQEKVEHMAAVVMQGRHQALGLAPEIERPLVDQAMRAGKLHFKETREELFKQHGFDPEDRLGQGLMQRIEGGKIYAEEKTALQVFFAKKFDYERRALYEKMVEGGVKAQDMGHQMSKLNQEHRLIGESVRKGVVPHTRSKEAYGFLQERGEGVVNDLTRQATEITEQTWEKAALTKMTDGVKKSFEAWKTHNEDVVKRFNEAMRELPEGAVEGGKGLVGIKWHVDDVFAASDFDDVDKILSATKQAKVHMARTGAGSEMADILGPDVSYEIYARQMAGKFLEKKELEAMKFMQGMRVTIARQAPAQAWETILGGYDYMLQFAKANMLMASFSWLKTNFFDNLGKAYIEGGFDNLGKTAKDTVFRKELRHDLMQLAAGNKNFQFQTKGLTEALESGALDNPTFDALMSRKEMSASLDESHPLFDRLARLKGEDKPFVLKRMMESWVRLLSKTVGRVGSYVEGSTRMLTYEHMKKHLMQHPELANQPKQVAEMAADIVKKTFFDYDDVSQFERAVFKRLVPFYSFYSKNVPYWFSALNDPEKLGRVAMIQAARDNVGSEVRKEDEESLGPHLKGNNPRYVGKNEKGDDKYVITPNMSFDDAIKTVFAPVDAVIEKGSPLLKALYEIPAGKDLFTDSELYPSAMKDKKKFLFSRGFKLAAVAAAAEKLPGVPDGALGVFVDKNGNPYTTKDSTALVDKVFQTLWPQGFIEQIAGSMGKVYHDKESVMEAFTDRLGPVETVAVSQDQKRMNRQTMAKEGKVDGRGR